MYQPDVSSRLAAIVRERSRILAPAVLVGFAFFELAAEPLGIRPDTAVYAFTWMVFAALALLTTAAVTRRIPAGWEHTASAMVLWCPMLATVVSLYSTRNPVFELLLIVQVASVGVLLSTPWVLATEALAAGVGVPLLFRTDAPFQGVVISCLVSTSLFALLIHLLARRGLEQAERHKFDAVETSHELANQVQALERLQEQLLHAQRMEAVGTLAAGLAHDMNNVLSSISGLADLLRADVAPTARRDLDQIIQQADRGASLTRGLLAFSRRDQYRKRVVPVAQVVKQVLPLLARTLPKTIEIRDELAVGDARVLADPVHLEQVLVNLGLNAADAMAGKGRLVVAAEVVTVDGVEHARLRVTDTGTGMDAATRRRLFEPFFTTKPRGRGTGLGLSIVWGIVKAHDGAIAVESEPGAGATFTIDLPLTTRQPSVLEIARLPAEPVARATTVLVVDDETAVRDTTRRLVERMGLEVITASDGAECLARFAEREASIGLVILDMGMPVMGGAECFRKLRERSRVPVLIATGYAVEAEIQELVAAGAQILEKPFAAADLKSVISSLVAPAA